MPAVLNADEQRVLALFAGSIRPVPVSAGYRIALLLVAVMMVLLPIIYLGIIALVGWAWWWYACHATGIFSATRGGRSGLIALVIYLGPLVCGGVLILFMFKPLFARAPRSADPLSVEERKEPFLYAFIRKLCAAVGAPEPRRIDVTCEVNASASYRRGWLSMLGSDLVLTIGLPLVAGQNLRQFTGVLAHEFGHFAQGWAMRANYVIRTVDLWFARVVYQRDAWDQWLVETANSDSHWSINIIFQLARGFVWLTRQVLWILMLIGRLLSSLLSRHMEFDADRHAARLVGREHFASALRELPVLSAAESGAHQDLGNAWREKRLADDIPQLIGANVLQIPSELRQKLIKEGLEHTAGMYASHPATRDRVTACDNEPDGGVFSGVDGPAKALFRDFSGLCKRCTLSWYTESAGLAIVPANLVPTSRLVEAYERSQVEAKAARELLGPLWQGTTLFAPAEEAQDPEDVPAFEKELEAAEQAVVEARQAMALSAAGQRRPGAKPDLASARSRRDDTRRRLAKAAAAAKVKLATAQGEETDRITACLATLAGQQVAIDDLREGFAVLAVLLNGLEGKQEDTVYINKIRSELREQRGRIVRLRDACRRSPYPFEHAQAGIDLASYLVSELPDANDPGAVMGCSEQTLTAVYALHGRALSRWAALARS